MNFVSNPVKNTFGLTEREMEVLTLLVEGKSNPEISKEFVITQNTAKAHVGSILLKMEVTNRVEAVVKAIKSGLVQI